MDGDGENPFDLGDDDERWDGVYTAEEDAEAASRH